MLTKRTKKVIIYKHSGNESPLRKKERCARVLELADKHVSEACVLRTYGFDSRFSHHLIGDKADVKITSALLFFATPIATLAAAFPCRQIFTYKKGEFFILHYRVSKNLKRRSLLSKEEKSVLRPLLLHTLLIR